MAKRLRAVLEESLLDELDEILQQMTIIRGRLASDFTTKIKSIQRRNGRASRR